MRTTTKWLIGTSAAVLVVTNAVVLAGVAYNRHAPPQSLLNLTERELSPNPDWMWGSGDNSGLSLRLRFRTESLPQSPLYSWGVPWLDKSKLAALGIDVSTPATDTDAATHYRRLLGREVLLVLEFDGPARERTLLAARDAVARLQTSAAQEALQQEQNEQSRLFVIDAGLDRQALERRYTDRGKYAIVRGRISPVIVGEGSGATLYGMVTGVSCADINVPLQFRGVFPGGASMVRWKRGEPFHVTVAFGRRLEPWIVSAKTG